MDSSLLIIGFAFILILILMFIWVKPSKKLQTPIKKQQIIQGIFPSQEILYKSLHGDYQRTNIILDFILSETQSTFNSARPFVFYFDDPNETEPKKCRGIYGILIDQSEQLKIPQFLERNQRYSRYRITSKFYYVSFQASMSDNEQQSEYINKMSEFMRINQFQRCLSKDILILFKGKNLQGKAEFIYRMRKIEEFDQIFNIYEKLKQSLKQDSAKKTVSKSSAKSKAKISKID